MRRDQNEKSRTTSDPARTSSSRRARSVASMSRWTSSGSGIVVMPRDQASWSKESLFIPWRSYCRATVDLPEPAGPHMKITRAMTDTLCAWAGGRPERGGGVAGQRVAVAEAGDSRLEAGQPAERGGGLGAVDVEHA